MKAHPYFTMMADEQQQKDTMNTTAVLENDQEHVDYDERKVFVSRIPSAFDEAAVQRLLESKLGEGSVTRVALAYPQEEDNTQDKAKDHRGFAFCTLDSHERQQEALELGTVRGGLKETSTKKHTLYLRPIVRNDTEQQGICFLWANHRCPHGDKCKFAHVGEGSCLDTTSASTLEKKKRKKCFNYKKNKCKDPACPFSHDFQVSFKDIPQRPNYEKDCLTWKNKGKCNKKETCPYRHDESIQKKALEKRKRKREKERQPLSIRVFGLNYETKESDVREYFQHCGPIMELTFPTFEDSGRSKGYCGILFQSPKAVAKAVELDGKELHGRWLRVQAGKMYLKQWEEQHEAGNEKRNKDEKQAQVGEFGQRVKRRKQHGFKDA